LYASPELQLGRTGAKSLGKYDRAPTGGFKSDSYDESWDVRGMYLVLVTCPKDSEERIANEVLKRRLAACVSILDGVHSLYWWEGRRESAEESLLLIKTRRELFGELERTVRGIHPYKTPEIISFRAEEGSSRYLDWISKETRPVVRKKLR
jgi:periplasmic divalent cation tolerance protein